MPAANKKIAIFDFDGTLIRGDSLPLYLGELTGYGCMMFALASVFFQVLRTGNGTAPDRRTAVKREWLRRLLTNVPIATAEAAAERLRRRIFWRSDLVDRLLWHKSQGHEILIATGALEPYIHILLRDLPVDVVFATDIGINEGQLTGEILGPNSVRAAKAERVAAWLKERGPYAESWGYGNAPHDLPMLALCTNQKIV